MVLKDDDRLLELLGREVPALLQRVERADGVHQREGQLLRWRRARFLQVVGADVERIPFRSFGVAPRHHVADQPHRGLGREDVCSSRGILLENVVLNRAAELGRVCAALFRHDLIEQQ